MGYSMRQLYNEGESATHRPVNNWFVTEVHDQKLPPAPSEDVIFAEVFGDTAPLHLYHPVDY